MEDIKKIVEDVGEPKVVEPTAKNTNKEAVKPEQSEEKKYSDSEVDAIIDKKLAKWKKQQEEQITEATKLAAMNEQEKIAYENKKVLDELTELKKANNLHQMETTARGILLEAGVNIPDSIIKVLITEDAETTKANVDNFSKLFKESVSEELKKATRQNPPTVSNLGEKTKQTKDIVEFAKNNRVIK